MATFSQLPATLDLMFTRGDSVVIPLEFTGVTLSTYTLSATLYQVLSETTVRGTSYADRIRYAFNTNTTNIYTTAVSLPQGKITMQFPPSVSRYFDTKVKYRFALQWRTSGASFTASDANTLTVLSGSVTGIDP